MFSQSPGHVQSPRGRWCHAGPLLHTPARLVGGSSKLPPSEQRRGRGRMNLLCLYSDFSSAPLLPFVCHLCSCHLPLWSGLGTEGLLLTGQPATCSEHLDSGQSGLVDKNSWSGGVEDSRLSNDTPWPWHPLSPGERTPVPSVLQSGWLARLREQPRPRHLGQAHGGWACPCFCSDHPCPALTTMEVWGPPLSFDANFFTPTPPPRKPA